VRTELRRIGVNVNQLARSANSGIAVPEAEAREAFTAVCRMRTMVSAALGLRNER